MRVCSEIFGSMGVTILKRMANTSRLLHKLSMSANEYTVRLPTYRAIVSGSDDLIVSSTIPKQVIDLKSFER
jgi:hypothetical protein